MTFDCSFSLEIESISAAAVAWVEISSWSHCFGHSYHSFFFLRGVGKTTFYFSWLQLLNTVRINFILSIQSNAIVFHHFHLWITQEYLPKSEHFKVRIFFCHYQLGSTFNTSNVECSFVWSMNKHRPIEISCLKSNYLFQAPQNLPVSAAELQ